MSTLAANGEPARPRRSFHDAPSEIGALAERAIGCRRLAMVDVTDEASDVQVEAAFKTLRCDRLDADVAKLHRRYSGSESTLKEIEAAYKLSY
ncbi:MAG: hypothetical protein JSR91_16305 [Proteobacteria bacterium]|nr:hypothetical protein [Pseudomonadota bacterium]